MAAEVLPEYDDPPVVETLLGVEFAPLRGWTIVHFGLLFEAFKASFPDFETRGALPASQGYWDDVRVDDERTGEVSAVEPYVRCLYIDPANDRLIQVQRDRFVYNWRRETKKRYPRYLPNVRPNFEQQWDHFVAFLERENLGQPRIRRCEVTYVNHFERGKLWQSIADLPELLTFWRGSQTEPGRDALGFVLPPPQYADINMRYGINEHDHLDVELRRAERKRDQAEILQFSLTAQVVPDSPDRGGVLSAFDLGRRWIVRGFTELTTPRAHALWGRSR